MFTFLEIWDIDFEVSFSHISGFYAVLKRSCSICWWAKSVWTPLKVCFSFSSSNTEREVRKMRGSNLPISWMAKSGRLLATVNTIADVPSPIFSP